METITDDINDMQNYIRWQVFDEIPERVYTIECEGYFDKNGSLLTDETSIKHLTNGKRPIDIDVELEIYDDICT